MAAKATAVCARDPLQEQLDRLRPLDDLQKDDMPKRMHCRADSEASTDVGSCFDGPSPPRSSTSEHGSLSVVQIQQTLDKLSRGQESGPKESPHTPEDIGGLLLQAFQIRDDYLRLQERFVALESAAHEEVCGLRTELRSAHDQIWTLQVQAAAMHSARAADVSKKNLPETIEGVLKVVGRRAASCLQSACFKAWHRHVASAGTLSATRKARGDSCLLLCRCLYAWVGYVNGWKRARASQMGELQQDGLQRSPSAAAEVLVATTERSASKQPRDRYQGLRTPEPLSRNTTAQNTPRCSPLGSPAPTPGRALQQNEPAVFSSLPEVAQPAALPSPPPLPGVSSCSPDILQYAAPQAPLLPQFPPLFSCSPDIFLHAAPKPPLQFTVRHSLAARTM